MEPLMPFIFDPGLEKMLYCKRFNKFYYAFCSRSHFVTNVAKRYFLQCLGMVTDQE